MAVGYRFPRGTRAALNAKATGGTIVVGQPYLITDEGRIAVGLTTSTYEVYAKESEVVPISVGTSAPSSPATGDLWVDTN